MNEFKTVCVFAGSSATVPQDYLNLARELGENLAQYGFRVAYGAGAVGCMGYLADGVESRGGELIGVIPQFMVNNGWCRNRLSAVHVTKDMSERKQILHDLGDAVIALPGGIGTYEELTETITWKQLGLIDPTIIIMNQRGFYNGLIEQIQHATDENFMGVKETTGRRAEDLFCVVETVEEALRLLGLK